MKRVLVIGASSYIARSFKEYVEHRHTEDGWEIDLVNARHEEWKTVDFRGYDTVLHAAAIVHQKECRMGEDLYRHINYELPLEIGNRAKKSGVKQLVFLSTMAVYGDEKGRISSKTITSPCTFYGKYKRLAEIDLWQKKSDDFKVVIVRPPMVYGKGCKGNFSRLLKLSSISVIFPKIENRRSMIYIDNLCEYIYLVMKGEMEGIGCPQNERWVETSDLVLQMRKFQNKNTIMIKCDNTVLFFFIQKIPTLRKIFGDNYYEIEDSYQSWINLNPIEYGKVGYMESIKKSIK